jgi:hypothetical protein
MTRNDVDKLEEQSEETTVEMCKFIRLNAVSSKESIPRYTYVSPGVVLPRDAMLIRSDTSRLAELSSSQGFM